MVPFDFEPRTRVVFGRGAVQRVGQLARGLDFHRVFLVADRGLVKAGHVATVTASLESDRR
jgi:alcohol dehydrogenase class IV